LTVKIFPPTDNVPVRAAPEFAAILIVIAAVPEPLEAPETDSHEAMLVTDHAQPDPVLTVNEVVPAVEDTFAFDNDRL
jgi:hypothetical protein